MKMIGLIIIFDKIINKLNKQELKKIINYIKTSKAEILVPHRIETKYIVNL